MSGYMWKFRGGHQLWLTKVAQRSAHFNCSVFRFTTAGDVLYYTFVLQCYSQSCSIPMFLGLLFVVCRPRVLTGLHVDALSVGAVVGKWSLSFGGFAFSGGLFDVPIDGMVVALHAVNVDRHSLLVRFDFADVDPGSSQDP